MPPTLHELGMDRLSAADRLAVAEASVAREAGAAALSDAQRARGLAWNFWPRCNERLIVSQRLP